MSCITVERSTSVHFPKTVHLSKEEMDEVVREYKHTRAMYFPSFIMLGIKQTDDNKYNIKVIFDIVKNKDGSYTGKTGVLNTYLTKKLKYVVYYNGADLSIDKDRFEKMFGICNKNKQAV